MDHIVRLERDGTTRNIVDEPEIWQAVPSPVDGSLVYRARDATGDSLVQTDAAGKHRTVLVLRSGEIDSPGWSPDGKQLTFNVISRSRAPTALSLGIYVIAAGGGTPKLIQAEGLNNWYMQTAWSPDSRRLLLYGDRLIVKDLASGTQVDVGYPGDAVWSPSSAAVYIARPGWRVPNQALVRADATTGKETPYTLGKPEQFETVNIWGLHPLKDGSFYAFLATTEKGDSPHASGVGNPRFALVHISSNGRDIQKLNDTTYEYGEALWAADDSGVLFNTYSRSNPLLWLPADGGEPTVIVEDNDTPEYGVLANAHWGPR
jgi:hypothetical protein